MRFTADGPDIPNELLRARDKGQVVFFCGAGISLARAKLPDFFGLTENVMARLKPSETGKAKARFTMPERIVRETKGRISWKEASALISADKVFMDLYGEFDRADIEWAVARALHTDANTDRSAHQIILDLARTPAGRTQLVTTNFDRLFETAPGINTYCFPDLPDLTQPDRFDGVVYLHGRIDETGVAAEKPGFILSSAEFGHAYMTDGRAAQFLKDLIKDYTLVFLGYSADDPPISYLLEALGRVDDENSSVYAFHAGTESEARSVWDARGVKPITYSADNHHLSLWTTLEAWSARARDRQSWMQETLKLAAQRPSELEPYERGRVAALVSSREGAALFASAEQNPPGEWLWVFDPRKRLGKPKRSLYNRDKPAINPFSLYGLDSDIPPALPDPDQPHEKRDVDYASAWNAFSLTPADIDTAKAENIASHAELYTAGIAVLPQRLFSLGRWIAKTCEQPATLAWAGAQQKLNPEYISLIESRLDDMEGDADLEHIVRQWRYLFEAWDSSVNGLRGHDMRWYRLQRLARKATWTSQLVRAYGQASRPAIKTEPNYAQSGIAPEDDNKHPYFRIDIGYPSFAYDIEVPKKWRVETIAELRESLRQADILETETGPVWSFELVPIRKGDDPNVNQYRRGEGISGLIALYTNELKRLAKHDKVAARREVKCWPEGASMIFPRLRIWALGEKGLIAKRDQAKVLKSISRKAFWHSGNQRDLLTSLAMSWSSLTEEAISIVEAQLLKGPKRKKSYDKDKATFSERKAFMQLSRLHWLANNGCEFSFDLAEISEALRSDAPNWKPEYADGADEELGSRGGFVRTETDYDALLPLELRDIIPKARELSGRTSDYLVEKDPFAGFATTRPLRALAVLRHTTSATSTNQSEWRTFLNHDRRASDTPWLSLLILHRLMNVDDTALKTFLYALTWWFRDKSGLFSIICPKVYDLMYDRIVSLISKEAELGASKIISNSSGKDWLGSALNSSVGHLTDAAIRDNRWTNTPSEKWLSRMIALLDMPEETAALAMAELSQRLNWIDYHQPDFAAEILERAFSDTNSVIAEAFWSGFSHGRILPSDRLFSNLKSFIVQRVLETEGEAEDRRSRLSAALLANWRRPFADGNTVHLTDAELTNVLLHGSENFRLSMLSHYEGWAAHTLREPDNELNYLNPKQVSDFFKNIWPRQTSVRTSKISRKLFSILTHNIPLMDVIFEDVLPLLVTVEDQHLSFYFRDTDTIVEDRAQNLFRILLAVLPTQTRFWPYNLSAMLDRMITAEPSLEHSSDMIRLREKLLLG